MEDYHPPQKVSYLQARDPSILSWNRYGMEQVKRNLDNDFGSESTIPSIPSEKEDNHINVYLRIKPGVINYENIYTIEDDTLMCKVPERSHSARNNRDNQNVIKKYQFTKIFRPETTQQDLFNQIIKPKILNFINGFNSTLLTYGSSGAGKTFTMVGTADQPGIIPRALEYLFRTLPAINFQPEVKPLPNEKIIGLDESQKAIEHMTLQSMLPQGQFERSIHVKTYRAMQQRLSTDPVATVGQSPTILGVYVSFAEIYNELVYDLLQPPLLRGQQRPKLKIGGVQDHIYIKDLKYVYVRSGLEAYQILQYGINNLKYADTALNMHSSRSHCIFTVRLIQGRDVETSLASTFNFCDLAGSERLKKSMNVGDRLKESNNINNSLLVLGRCISVIRDGQYGKENVVPPFRDSKLTQIFQRALMGKEDIVMIVNINPSGDMYDESQHTLNFAGIANKIIVEKPPARCLRTNRFSRNLQQDLLPSMEEEDRDEELRELRNERANLVLELSELRLEKDQAIDAERQHLTKQFRILIAYKDEEITKLKEKMNKLEQENEELREQTKEKAVIVISDDESEEENEEVLRLRKENLKFKSEIYDLKEEFRNEIEQKDIQIERLEEEFRNAIMQERRTDSRITEIAEELKEAKLTIEDAKSTFAEERGENEKLRSQIADLTSKLLTLQDDFDLQKSELEYLRQMNTKHMEEIEKLEDERFS